MSTARVDEESDGKKMIATKRPQTNRKAAKGRRPVAERLKNITQLQDSQHDR